MLLRHLLTFLLAFTPVATFGQSLEVIWPTPNPAFALGEPRSKYVQPTASGREESALFGCIRNSGTRFHEGLDLLTLERDSRGEATDPIFASLKGRVVYISRISGRSLYGRYVVLEHTQYEPAVYTLYAHLASIADDLEEGQTVEAGAVLGVMGRSAMGYYIPRRRAHLHFEIGLRLSDDFQAWYDRQNYQERNYHRNYNGLNLVGVDPLDFMDKYRSGEFDTLQAYFNQIQPAYSTRVLSQRTPDFIKRYPSLLTREMPTAPVVGWDITWTWWGLPLRWTPLTQANLGENDIEGTVKLRSLNEDVLRQNSCRKTVVWRSGKPTLGDGTLRNLQILFGFR